MDPRALIQLTGENGTAGYLVGFVMSEFLLLIAVIIILQRSAPAAAREELPPAGL